MRLKTLEFIAIVVTALALVPAGAHLFALPNKIGLTQDAYFTVQDIYRGWALLGALWIVALAANAALAAVLRHAQRPYGGALVGALCFVASFVIFFIWTQPANRATANWTSVPANWEALRTQWEYSHAVNAGIMLVALCAVTWSALRSRD